MNKKIAVIIPCYNESATIKKVIEDVKKNLPEADIYVYDNNSTDGSDKIARDAGVILKYERRQGKGNVIRTAFREINSDCYIIVDGDDTYSLENLKQMVDMVLYENVDMVIGDRLSSTYFVENKRPFHNLGNKIVRQMVNKFFNADIKDIMTGYRAFSFNFVKSFPVITRGFEIETEMTIHALDKNFSIAQVPINYKDRQEDSESKLNTYSDGAKVLLTIFKLVKDYKPLVFFSCLAFFLFLFASILFFPIYIEFKFTGQVLKFPTLIISGFIALSSLLTFMCGLILDTESRNAKQNFELILHMLNMLKNNDHAKE